MSQTSESRGVWFATGAALCFSAKAIFVKLAYPYGVAPLTLLALRMLFALPVFIVVALRTRSALSRRDIVAMILLGLVGGYAASLLDFLGLQYITAGLERLVLFTYPTLTLLIALFAFGRPFARQDVVALIITWLGIALAFAHDLAVAVDVPAVWLGGGYVFASAFCYAFYLAGAGELVQRIGSLRASALTLCVSSAVVFVHFALVRPVADLVQPAPVLWLAAAMGLFSTVLAVFMQMASIEVLGATRAAMIGTLGPVMTIALGAIMLGEPISARQMLGTALVLFGVRLASVSRTPLLSRAPTGNTL
jgi:drug/metabolite transporter (DMT)-like permease